MASIGRPDAHQAHDSLYWSRAAICLSVAIEEAGIDEKTVCNQVSTLRRPRPDALSTLEMISLIGKLVSV